MRKRVGLYVERSTEPWQMMNFVDFQQINIFHLEINISYSVELGIILSTYNEFESYGHSYFIEQ